jgi:hypothetical protein
VVLVKHVQAPQSHKKVTYFAVQVFVAVQT